MTTLRVRRVTCLAVVLLILILGTTALERRLAEADFNDDIGCFLADADSIDGDELLSRLIPLNDVSLPEAPSDAGPAAALTTADEPDPVAGPELSTPGSRAPPTLPA